MACLSCFDGRLLVLIAGLLTCTSSTLLGFDLEPFTVASGRYFTFTVNNYSASATGRNNYGQLGIGTTTGQKLSAQVNLPEVDSEVVDIAAGAFHSIFQTKSGSAYVTGRNHYGQLGLGPSSDVKDPAPWTLPEVDATVVGVAAGYAHSLFLLDSGSVFAAGLNNAGQLGDGTTDRRETPVRVNLTGKVVGITAGYDFSYFKMDDKTVFAAGQNLGGQLGDGTRVTRFTPVLVDTGGRVDMMSTGESHGLFLMDDGVVKGTGANFDGQLGIQENAGGKHKAKPTPIEVATAHRVHTGGDSSCVITGDMWNAYCMGSNRDGQLGFGGENNRWVPKPVPDLPDFVEDIGIGYSHALFIVHPGDSFVAGTNDFGELGNNGTDPKGAVIANPFIEFSFQETTRTTPPPTPAPPPTAAPTPLPTAPTPAPTPAPTRAGNSDGPPRNELFIWIVAVVIGVIALVINVALRRQGARQMEGEEVAPNQNQLELMRAEIDA